MDRGNLPCPAGATVIACATSRFYTTLTNRIISSTYPATCDDGTSGTHASIKIGEDTQESSKVVPAVPVHVLLSRNRSVVGRQQTSVNDSPSQCGATNAFLA